jgi:hypothetical protein
MGGGRYWEARNSLLDRGLVAKAHGGRVARLLSFPNQPLKVSMPRLPKQFRGSSNRAALIPMKPPYMSLSSSKFKRIGQRAKPMTFS